MAKKKMSKKEKIQRRKKEAIKAHKKSSIRGQFADLVVNSSAVGSPSSSKARKTTHRLNMKSIRLDLIKTIIFSIAVIGFLLFLKSQNLEFDFSINK